MKRFTLLLLAFNFQLSIFNSLWAQTDVSNFVPGSTIEGVCYYLPKTAFRITIVAEKNTVVPGELSKYAFRYLRLKDVPSSSSETWAIKSVNIEPYGVPDPTKAYSIKVKNKTVAPLVSLTRDGILMAINAEEQEVQLPALPQGTTAEEPLNPKQFMNQEMLSASSETKLAELCAQEIYDIRESRNALVRGEADNTPKDGEQLRLMLNQLDIQAKALEQLFAGYTLTSTEVFSFDFLPTQETQKQLLFRFSQFSGLVDKDDLSGQPFYISIKNTGNLPARQDNPISEKKKAKLEQGVFYNVPARETIRIFDVNQTYLQAECSMGQFGYTEILSNILFDKKTSTRVSFHQETGGVKKLEQ